MTSAGAPSFSHGLTLRWIIAFPAFGVYAVEVDLDEDNARVRKIGNGVANIGIRPTVRNRGVLCETHLFDRDLDLYDKRLLVRLKTFLRPEQKFSGIEELIDQIGSDAESTPAFASIPFRLAVTEPICNALS